MWRLVLPVLLYVSIRVASPADQCPPDSCIQDGTPQVDGTPTDWDPDLSVPFSIGTAVYGYPGRTIPGIQAINYDISSVTNRTNAPIVLHLYIAHGVSPGTDGDGTHTTLSGPMVQVSGCPITIPTLPQGASSVEVGGTCTVQPADSAMMVSLGIINVFSTTQNIYWGLSGGTDARSLSFTGGSQAQFNIFPSAQAPMTFFANAGGVSPPSQNYSIPPFPNSLTVKTSTTTGGNWLAAHASSSSSPSTLTVTATSSGLPAAIYNGSVALTTTSGTLTLPISLTVLPATPQFIQQGAKFLVTTTNQDSGGMYQGTSVALSHDGNTAVVGAFGDVGGGGYGAAWTYSRAAGTWTSTGSFTFSQIGPASEGRSVSMPADGSFLLSGGPAYNNSFGAAWTSGGACGPALLSGSGAVGGTPAQGTSVALSADGLTALVGGPSDNGELGAVWVFTCSQGLWKQQAKLLGTATSGIVQQGWSVALSADGNTAIFGGPSYGSTGAAWVFTRSSNVWTQQMKLVGTGATGDAAQGSGVALSADGNTALVGGYTDAISGGAFWIFTRSGTTWSPQGGKLVGTGGVGANQGASVALSADGNTAAIGGPSDNSGAGAAWIFHRSGTNWSQVPASGKLVGSGATGLAGQGAVALSGDGNTLLLGGAGDNSSVGATWAFVMSGPAPTLTSINPTQVAAGSAGFTLTVNGSNFLNGATVQWNGSALPTTFGSVSQVTATVAANLIASPGSIPVIVVNPDGTPSGSATLTVNAPMLGITKTHARNFAQGENNATYTVTVSNASGALSTTGQVTVTDTVPAGMTLVSMAGENWTCPSGGNTCARSDPLAAGLSHPAITVTVNVAANATTPLTNQVIVSGGGSATASASDSTTVITPSLCDVDIDALVNVVDVQLMIDEALKAITPVHDLNHDGAVNVADVQIVLNAALGLGCSAH